MPMEARLRLRARAVLALGIRRERLFIRRDKALRPREGWPSAHPSYLPGCDSREVKELQPKSRPLQLDEPEQKWSFPQIKPAGVTGKNGRGGAVGRI